MLQGAHNLVPDSVMSRERKPLRAAMLIQEYPPIIGGAEQELAAQATVLARLGVDVLVLTRRWWPALAPFERAGGAAVYRLPASGPKAIAAIRYVLSATWQVGRLRPDLLHAHEVLSPATAGMLAKWLFRKPLVATVLRGGLLGDLTKIRRGWLGWLRRRLVLRSVDAFIVISEEIDRELQALGIPPERRFFVPNGVDTDCFAPASPDEKQQLRAKHGLPDGRIVVFTGRLEREKQVDQLLWVWPELLQQVPEAHLVVLGTGSLESELRARAGAQVHFLGGKADVAPYLRAADLFVLPSVTEGLSVSMLEAMACGLPVLVTRVGGAADVITHGQNGWLIPPGDAGPLLLALAGLLQDGELRQSLGSRARACILERYAVQQISLQLLSVYNRLLEK